MYRKTHSYDPEKTTVLVNGVFITGFGDKGKINVSRSEESVRITTLAEATDAQVDMFTTVIIGNSRTRVIKDKMVTPRGYHL